MRTIKQELELLEKVVNNGVSHIANRYKVNKAEVMKDYIKAYNKQEDRYVYKTGKFHIPALVEIESGYHALDILMRYYRMKENNLKRQNEFYKKWD